MIALGVSLGAQSIGIIGEGGPLGNWDEDVDMTQDPDSSHLWTYTGAFVGGPVKFRQDDSWDVNWGALDFPSGIGEQGGPNIPVFTGDYTVHFNSNTGEYHFDVDSDIGIIGDAVNGWDEDVDMYKDTADANKFYIEIELSVGPCKFRKDDDWAVNWGSPDFPTGVGTQGGDNIEVSKAGVYFVTLDTSTGEYHFEENISYESIGIIGDAVGGWDDDIDMTQDANNPSLYTISMTFMDGGAKFRANDSWDENWGGPDFPSGVATPSSADNIPVTAGDYLVSFNVETLEYSFTEIIEYATIGIIGTATPGGWTDDTDLEKDPNDGSIWSLRMELTDGLAKFRADDDWAVNWGGDDFPAGVAIAGGGDIPVTAGEYNITFNSVTGAYNFEEIIEYDQVSLVGKSGPFGGWPEADDGGARDTYLEQDANDPHAWTGTEITLSDYAGASDEGVKFRADTDWAVNWGAEDFPSGVATQDGANIQCVAGTYNVSFRSDTGEYTFSSSSSTEDVLSPSDISVFPNPANQTISVSIENELLTGNLRAVIFDMNGKIVFTKNSNTLNGQELTLNIANLTSGNYLLQLTNENVIVGKRISVLK